MCQTRLGSKLVFGPTFLVTVVCNTIQYRNHGITNFLYNISLILDDNALQILNFVAPGYAIFHAFGRIGCFFVGCCYGKKASWGFALWDEPGVLRIPIQLIESIFLVGLTVVLLIIERKDKNNIFKIYMLSYAVFRF